MWDQSEKNILVAGHRGLPELYPENTLLSFQKAIDAGVDMLELDVQMTKDGRFVIMHDLNVDRTTDGKGPLKEKTFSEIKALDAANKFGARYGTQRVPELVEFMELVKKYPDLLLDFELKEYPTDGNEKRAYETVDRTIEMIEKYGFGGKCVLNAFSATLLEYIETEYHHKYRLHGYYPKELMRGDCKRDPYEFVYCACVTVLEKDKFDMMKQKGIDTWAGASVKDQASANKAVECGATLVTCNNPHTVLSILKNMGLHK